MSGKAMGWACEDVRGLPESRPRSVLQYLANYANRHGGAWPKARTIARDLECHVNTVRAALKVLAERGIITKKFRFDLDGRQTSTYYQLNYSDAGTEDSVGGYQDAEEGAPQEPERGGTEERVGGGTEDQAASKGTLQQEPTTEPKSGPNCAENNSGTAGAPVETPPNAHANRPFKEYFETWNEMTERSAVELARVEVLQESWKRMIRTREREPLFNWDKIISKAVAVKGVKKSWFTLEFLIKNDRGYAKLLGGNYDEAYGGSSGGQNTPSTSKQEDAISRARGAPNV